MIFKAFLFSLNDDIFILRYMFKIVDYIFVLVEYVIKHVRKLYEKSVKYEKAFDLINEVLLVCFQK